MFPSELQRICDQVGLGLEVRGNAIGRDVGERFFIVITGFNPRALVDVYEYPIKGVQQFEELRYEQLDGGCNPSELHEFVKQLLRQLSIPKPR